MFKRLLITLLLLTLVPNAWAKPDLKHEWAAGAAGAAAFDREDWKEAYTHFDAVIQEDPNIGAAYYNRALARVAVAHDGTLDMQHLSKGAPESAYKASIADLNHAIELDPKNADAYMWRGIFHKATNDWKSAIADADQAAALDPQWKDAAQDMRGTLAVRWILYLVLAAAGLILALGGYRLTHTLVQVARAEKATRGE
jgi:tetratricopeptide (TPR) repeat protein